MIAPKKFFRTADKKLGIEWANGRRVAIDVRTLRLLCPCALCVDEISGKKILDDSLVPKNVALEHLQSIGRYAVGITFSDGHNSGIYPYEMLYHLTLDA